MVLHGINLPEGEISEFCRRHQIRKLALFGSVLREDFRPDSDIDILVEFEPGEEPGLMRLARMERELAQALGKAVDLRTPEDLSDRFRNRVIQSALVQYVAS
jgi:uncharacterized protein